MIDDPLFYLAAVPGILITGAAKGGLGAGLGILAVPLIALTAPIGQTAGILLPILLLMDAFGLWAYRGRWHGRNLMLMAPGALVGIAVGTATFHLVSEQMVRLIIGSIAVIFTLNHWRKRGGNQGRRPARVWGVFWGAVSGFTSFVAHSGGPPASVFLLPQRLDKTEFVGTTVVYFAFVNLVKLAPYAWLGLLSPGNLATAGVLAPLAPLGIGLGVYLHNRISPEWFYRLAYILVFLAGVKLLLDGLGLLSTPH